MPSWTGLANCKDQKFSQKMKLCQSQMHFWCLCHKTRVLHPEWSGFRVQRRTYQQTVHAFSQHCWVSTLSEADLSWRVWCAMEGDVGVLMEGSRHITLWKLMLDNTRLTNLTWWSLVGAIFSARQWKDSMVMSCLLLTSHCFHSGPAISVTSPQA